MDIRKYYLKEINNLIEINRGELLDTQEEKLEKTYLVIKMAKQNLKRI